ncbi:MAG: FKBP-type peptidyl-prolyl cis-trans isomerase [Dehalococcoidia bacterium]
MKVKLLTLAAALALFAGCGSSSNNSAKTALTTPTPAAAGTPIPTIRQGTPRPGQTPRPTAAAASQPPGSPSAGIPPVPAGTGPIQTTASGLQYEDITVGSGAAAQSDQSITVNYTGWLDNGTVFDSSLNAGRTPFKFNLGQGQVIKGWDEGVQGMKVGGKRRLIIPGALAYGPQGRPPTIPPNATLTFDIGLVSIP